MMLQKSAARHSTEAAQAYKGGVYDRSLTPDILDSAPRGSFTTITYETMHHIVETLAAGFRELGVKPNDRVGIFANTRLEWAHTDFALLGTGATVTTIYASSTPARVEFLLSNSDSIGVIVENESQLGTVLRTDISTDLSFIVSMDSLPADRTDNDQIYTLRDVYERGHTAGTDDYHN
jgi:long-chain acyl-CoA synthetase